MGAAKGTAERELERFVAKRLRLEETRGSGAVKGDGDAKSSYKQRVRGILPIMVEAKHTSKQTKTLSVPLDVIDKAATNACRRGLIPVVVKQHGNDEPLVVMRFRDFEYMYKTALQLSEELYEE